MTQSILSFTKKAVNDYIDHYHDERDKIKREMDKTYADWYPKTKEEHTKVIEEIVECSTYDNEEDEWDFDLTDCEFQYLFESLKTHFDFHDYDYDHGYINWEENEEEIIERIENNEWKKDVFSQELCRAFKNGPLKKVN